jgi:hypothetical protein
MLTCCLMLRYLVIALAANLMLWLSMLYTVFAIEQYPKHSAFFISISWITFLAPFLLIGFLAITRIRAY